MVPHSNEPKVFLRDRPFLIITWDVCPRNTSKNVHHFPLSPPSLLSFPHPTLNAPVHTHFSSLHIIYGINSLKNYVPVTVLDAGEHS